MAGEQVKPPACRVCGAHHWAREPHASLEKVPTLTVAIANKPPAKAPPDLLALVRALQVDVAELRADIEALQGKAPASRAVTLPSRSVTKTVKPDGNSDAPSRQTVTRVTPASHTVTENRHAITPPITLRVSAAERSRRYRARKKDGQV